MALPPPPRLAGSSAEKQQATLHLPSGIMSSPRCCWHKPTFILLFTGYPFSFPLSFANGLTRRLPVAFLPLLAAGLEEGLNLSNLKSRRGGRHAALVLGCSSWTSWQSRVWPRVEIFGAPSLSTGDLAGIATCPVLCVFSNPISIKHVVVPVPVTDGLGA